MYSRADVFLLKLKILSKSLKQSVTRTIYNKIPCLKLKKAYFSVSKSLKQSEKKTVYDKIQSLKLFT